MNKKKSIESVAKDVLTLLDTITALNAKVEELDDHVAFYATSINILEETVKKLSPDLEEDQPTWVDDIHKLVDQIILERKVRQGIIAELEKEQNANSCHCGDICQAFDNGFQHAISRIRNM